MNMELLLVLRWQGSAINLLAAIERSNLFPLLNSISLSSVATVGVARGQKQKQAA